MFVLLAEQAEDQAAPEGRGAFRRPAGEDQSGVAVLPVYDDREENSGRRGQGDDGFIVFRFRRLFRGFRGGGGLCHRRFRLPGGRRQRQPDQRGDQDHTFFQHRRFSSRLMS